MKSNSPQFTSNKDKTFVIVATLTQAEIDSSRQTVLRSAQAEFETKGFRKGKAPLNIVSEALSEQKIIEEILNRLVTKVYSDTISAHHVHPIISPQIKILNPPLELGKDWQIEITGCELPEISLDSKYLQLVSEINQKSESDNDKINHIISVLIQHSTVEIPDLLISSDVQNKLSQLVDQTQSAGLTVTQYLKSKNQTLEQYQKDLSVQVKNEWITNLAIDRIAKDQKLEISQKEVDDVISKNKALAKNLNLVYYLLTQQKVFEYLRKL